MHINKIGNVRFNYSAANGGNYLKTGVFIGIIANSISLNL